MNNEKGQALPMAIVALAIGALVVVPFLSHAGTTLLDSRLFAQGISSGDAADAGVEHAIWSLTEGGLAAQIPDVNNSQTYSLPESINGITPSVKVTTLSKSSGGGGQKGSIDNAIIDSYTFGANGGEMPSIIPVGGNIYAIAYGDWNHFGWVETVTITANGTITHAPIDTLEFDTAACYEPDIIHVSGDYYAVAYRGQNNQGVCSSFTIAANGSIGNSVRDTLTFDTAVCYEPDLVFVTGTYYAVAYRGQNNQGTCKTFTIAANGSIGNSVRDTLKFDTTASYEPSIILVSNPYFAISYRGSGDAGYLKTISIASNGNFAKTIKDTYTFNPNSCHFPDIVYVSGSVYGISYTGASPANGDWWGGILTTVNIATTGVITKSVIDEMVFDADSGDYSDIIHAFDDVYAIVYTSAGNQGKIVTVSINPNGTITDTIMDNLLFPTQPGFYPCITAIDIDTYAVAYTGSSQWVGILITIGIGTSTGPSITSYEIISTAGESTIRALVDTQNTTATIVSWFPN
jgi:hypothetical protein